MIELTSALKSRVTAHMSRNAMGSTNVISATPPTQPAVAVAAKVVGAAPIGLPTHRLFNLKPAAMQLESTLVVQEFPRSGPQGATSSVGRSLDLALEATRAALDGHRRALELVAATASNSEDAFAQAERLVLALGNCAETITKISNAKAATQAQGPLH